MIKLGDKIRDLHSGKIEKVIKINNYPEAHLEKQAIYTKSYLFFSSEEGRRWKQIKML